MVYVSDLGSEFDAPLEFVWEYQFGGAAHDSAHTTTRKPKFEKDSGNSMFYSSERLLRGVWLPDRMRISHFPPVCVVTEWVEGVLAGSKFVYVYTPRRGKTGIDVYGDYHSKILSPSEIEETVHEFLDSEFDADAPVIRDAYRQKKAGSKT